MTDALAKETRSVSSQSSVLFYYKLYHGDDRFACATRQKEAPPAPVEIITANRGFTDIVANTVFLLFSVLFKPNFIMFHKHISPGPGAQDINSLQPGWVFPSLGKKFRCPLALGVVPHSLSVLMV